MNHRTCNTQVTSVVRVQKRRPPGNEGPTPSLAGALGLEVTGGDVHPVEGRSKSVREHTGTVGEHAKAVLVPGDAFVHAASVTETLVVGLRKK